jgi:pyruvate dehydrogenase E2 component (dihydrolipoamide acetyltransferase)
MSVDVVMPALSPTMESGTIVRWLKRIGEPVRVGEVLLEVETDKATMEVEALSSGTLTHIHFHDGATDVPVNAPLGAITQQGYATDDARSAETTQGAIDSPEPASISQLLASRRQDDGSDRLFVSPIARRLLAEAGLDPLAIKGTGPNGRIIERDVKAAQAAGAGLPRPETAPAAPRAAAPHAAADLKAQFVQGRYEEIPHDNMRRSIARRLTEAKQTTPHFYLAAGCRLDALLALRDEINQKRPDAGERLSLNDFFIKALARALMLTPDANVSFAEHALLRHKHADISVAVSVPGGLMTPVLADADTKPLLAISSEMKELIRRAKARRLAPSEYEGGTAGLSNLGMFGVKEFAAIINPPQATMLAVGAAEKRVIAIGDAPVVAAMMTATLSADHRAVDGAAAAKLLSAFKTLVETPVLMLL